MEQPAGAATTIDWDALDAVLFDLDGVLTPTAEIHERAWKSMFDTFLAARADGGAWEPFSADDYLAYVDGKRRVDGVRSFLASRDITLPEGAIDDAPGDDTVNGLGNAKNAAFQQVLRRDGIDPYPRSVRFLDALDRRGTKVGVVSSSRNATEVLEAAGLADRFAVVVDGNVAAARKLPGKPAPDTFLAAAAELGVAAAADGRRRGRHLRGRRRPRRGLRPGRRRRPRRRARRPLEHGADLVVDDLDEPRLLAEAGRR